MVCTHEEVIILADLVSVACNGCEEELGCDGYRVCSDGHISRDGKEMPLFVMVKPLPADYDSVSCGHQLVWYEGRQAGTPTREPMDLGTCVRCHSTIKLGAHYLRLEEQLAMPGEESRDLYRRIVH